MTIMLMVIKMVVSFMIGSVLSQNLHDVREALFAMERLQREHYSIIWKMVRWYCKKKAKQSSHSGNDNVSNISKIFFLNKVAITGEPGEPFLLRIVGGWDLGGLP